MFLGDDLPCVADEQAKERILNGCETHFFSFNENAAAGQVDFQRAAAELCIFRQRCDVTKSDAQTSQEFSGAKRLRYIIVRAMIESCDLVFFTVAHGEHHDGYTAPF